MRINCFIIIITYQLFKYVQVIGKYRQHTSKNKLIHHAKYDPDSAMAGSFTVKHVIVTDRPLRMRRWAGMTTPGKEVAMRNLERHRTGSRILSFPSPSVRQTLRFSAYSTVLEHDDLGMAHPRPTNVKDFRRQHTDGSTCRGTCPGPSHATRACQLAADCSTCWQLIFACYCNAIIDS